MAAQLATPTAKCAHVALSKSALRWSEPIHIQMVIRCQSWTLEYDRAAAALLRLLCIFCCCKGSLALH